MRRKARKEQGAWQMQGESVTRPEVSTLVYGDGRGKLTNNKLKARGWDREGFCTPPTLAGLRLRQCRLFA